MLLQEHQHRFVSNVRDVPNVDPMRVSQSARRPAVVYPLRQFSSASPPTSFGRSQLALRHPGLGLDLAPIWGLILGLSIDLAAQCVGIGSVAGARWRTRRQRITGAIGGRTKRIVDLIIATTALILLSPMMLAVAIVIKLWLGGPVIYAHQRVGRDRKMFPCLKFRSMVTNGDEVLRNHLNANPQAAAEWRETRKLRNDPRITPLGHLLRASSLDELPQLINVLRGDMSCVGPRPVVATELERYGTTAKYYLSTRPGLTGLWQVSGRSNCSYAHRISLDCQYVTTWSLWLDIKILLLTIPALLNFDQAV